MSEAELQAEKDRINKAQNQRRQDRIARMSDAEKDEFYAKVRDGNKQSIDTLRDEVYAAYGGYVCACCGVTEPSFLSIDHVYNDGAEHRREENLKTTQQLMAWLRREGFPEGFQILCMNCQWGKRTHGICPHKTEGVTTIRKE
jgi:hypothetical protein